MADSSKPNESTTKYASAPSSRLEKYKQSLSEGMQTGRDRAKDLYGMDTKDVGSNIQDIISRRKEQMDQRDTVSNKIRSQEGVATRSLGAGQASRGITGSQALQQQAQVKRNSQRGIAEALFKNQQETLGAYQSLMGNVASNSMMLELGHGRLASAPNSQAKPQSSGSGSGTIICTELYHQGYMSEEIYIKDKNYGYHIRDIRPNVYIGYIFMATPIVRLMKKSRLFTKIISIPAMAWAKNMAGEKSFFGRLISGLGESLCGLVGNLIYNKGIYNGTK